MRKNETKSQKRKESAEWDLWNARDPSLQRAWRKHLTAVAKYIREGQPDTSKRKKGEPELVALVEDPFTSVEETCRHLTKLLQAFEVRNDRRAVFLSIYARVTEVVADRINRGDFENPNWVADYLVAFADLYREAIYDYETGNLEHLADPWQIAFETTEQLDTLVTQDALLGINAHINYDLAFALDEVGVKPDPAVKYEDHRAVTGVLRQLIDETQASLAEEYAPGIAVIDSALGRLDERLGICTIDECRDSAWRNAVAMNSRFWIRRRLARWITHATSTGTAYLILSPTVSTSVQNTLQEFEGDPTSDDVQITNI